MIRIEKAGEVPGLMADPDEQVVTCETPEDMQWMLDNLELVIRLMDNPDPVKN